MREPTDAVHSAGLDALTERMRATSGLGPLLADAEAVWRSRAEGSAADAALPAWRPFEDAFPTFYQFTNRPPR
jgi:hypothetical protein